MLISTDLIRLMIKFLLPLQSGVTISKLTEERRLSNQETKILQEKLVSLRAIVKFASK
jgi:hypothetical protein